MQTLAEKFLIKKAFELLPEKKVELPRILNIGAGESLVLEKEISKLGKQFISDRLDIENCTVNDTLVGKCWSCSVENMSPVSSDSYDLAMSNFVFEHLKQIDLAVKEVCRVLKVGGYFITTVPNPSAPEFLFARFTTKKTHEKIKKGKVWPTYYQYKSIKKLIRIFEENGMVLIEHHRSSFVQDILCRYKGLCFISKIYDKIINVLRLKFLMGHSSLVFKKLK